MFCQQNKVKYKRIHGNLTVHSRIRAAKFDSILTIQIKTALHFLEYILYITFESLTLWKSDSSYQG